MTARIPVALTIAGSDSSGGAGIQADLKTFSAFGVYGACAVTALTAQNTVGVHGVHPVPPAFVVAQIDAVLSDLAVGAIKTGMLASAAIVEAVALRLLACREVPLVVDPVMIATSGDSLLAPEAIGALRKRLIPLATLITPNIPEAAALLGQPEAVSEAQAADQARALLTLGCMAVLLKGGHGSGAQSTDVLATGDGVVAFVRPRVATSATHGTGCTLSAAIAALLASGATLETAVERAKSYVWAALQSGRDLRLGRGHGPVDHLYAIRRAAPPA
jgi:hydroxymethylpyrimidine/phosphomethylpyrimidine kinase